MSSLFMSGADPEYSDEEEDDLEYEDEDDWLDPDELDDDTSWSEWRDSY